MPKFLNEPTIPECDTLDGAYISLEDTIPRKRACSVVRREKKKKLNLLNILRVTQQYKINVSKARRITPGPVAPIKGKRMLPKVLKGHWSVKTVP